MSKDIMRFKKIVRKTFATVFSIKTDDLINNIGIMYIRLDTNVFENYHTNNYIYNVHSSEVICVIVLIIFESDVKFNNINDTFYYYNVPD